MTSSPTPTGPAGPTVTRAHSVTTPAASAPSRIGSRAGSLPNAPVDLASTGLTPCRPDLDPGLTRAGVPHGLLDDRKDLGAAVLGGDHNKRHTGRNIPVTALHSRLPAWL